MRALGRGTAAGDDVAAASVVLEELDPENLGERRPGAASSRTSAILSWTPPASASC